MNAMPQLAKMAAHSGKVLNFKCPYQAMVMKRLEQVSNRTVTKGCMPFFSTAAFARKAAG